jgi:hypothetical protein
MGLIETIAEGDAPMAGQSFGDRQWGLAREAPSLDLGFLLTSSVGREELRW